MTTNRRNHRILQCPESNSVVYARLFCFALLSSLILIANPGFYSHDELEKVNYIAQHGFLDYLVEHVGFRSSVEFEAVRPVSFLVEGFVSLFLPAYPFVVHLVDVLMHGAIASLLFVATNRLCGNRHLAWAAALVFLINPLVAFSVGWSGALMDRLYVFFGLVAFILSHSYISRPNDRESLFLVFIASALAILSKETAVILPGMLLVFLFFSFETIKNKRFWIALVVWSVPVALFLLYRMPALVNTFSGKVVSPYAGSLANIPEGLFIYFIYPFLPFLTEAHNWELQPSAFIGFAVAAHLVLLLLLWRAFSLKAALAYMVFYLVFLVPVLFIPLKGAHYLYGSGLAFSLAIGALLTLAWKRGHKVLAMIPIGLLFIGVLHVLVIQHYFYKTGTCLNTAMNTMESAYLADKNPEEMAILIEEEAPGHILRRLTFNKKNIGAHFPVVFEVYDWDKRNKAKTDYRFNCDCLVYKSTSNK